MDPRVLVLIAKLCMPPGNTCEEVTIDDSLNRPTLNELSCNYIAGEWIADWLKAHPGYQESIVARYGCIRLKPGEQPKLTWSF